MTFTSSDIPDLHDQVIIVTGANVGLGFETVKQLSAHHPARIYLAARSKSKAEDAIKQIQQEIPNACSLTFLELDLASFESVKRAAASFMSEEQRLDILINNAGIMMTPEGLTEEGYEIQFGTNVIGTALFTQLLLPVLRSTARVNPQTRAVILASAAHARAPSDVYDFEQLKTDVRERHTTARYTTSKLANIHYAKALAKRVPDIKIIPVHPGMVATNLHHASTGTFLKPFLNFAIMFATKVEKGVLSQLWASVSPEAESGQYYGPVGKAENGSELAQNREVQAELFKWIRKELRDHVEVFE